MNYEYDLFISYRRSPNIQRWVRNHLLPRLQDRLNEAAPREICIACDVDIRSGQNWPEELKRRLTRSGMLLMVCSADFFRSDWCMAEWESFRARERQLGYFNAANPSGLVYPIRYADGDHFHQDINAAQCRVDFRELNSPEEVFRDTPRYIDFDRHIQNMAAELVPMLLDLPNWRDDFPIVEPAPLPPHPIGRPVL